jgi:hypothetical protein
MVPAENIYISANHNMVADDGVFWNVCISSYAAFIPYFYISASLKIHLPVYGTYMSATCKDMMDATYTKPIRHFSNNWEIGIWQPESETIIEAKPK